MIALAVVAFGLAGFLAHDLRERAEPGHEHVAHDVPGLCLLVLALVVPLVARAPATGPAVGVPGTFTRRESACPVSGLALGGARASPAWLQRFRN
jgi:hypothetical protein